ncbi:MAG: hypothetical protein ABIJ45_01125 [Candidatus Zixiibacteriota bacterium]
MSLEIDSIHPTYHSFNTKEILLNTIRLYWDNISLFFAISMLGTLPSFLSIYYSESPLLRILRIVDLLVGLLANAALIIAASKRHRNETITITECFISIKRKYWRFVGVFFIVGLTMLLGSLVFIIPGIYLGVIFCLSDIAVIIEEREETGVFKLSKELIRGFFWKTLWFLVIIGSPHMISFFFLTTSFPALALTWLDPEQERILFTIFYAVFIPFFIVGRVLLYHKLKEIKAVELSKNPDALIKSPYGCLFAIGLVIGVYLLGTLWASIFHFLKQNKFF